LSATASCLRPLPPPAWTTDAELFTLVRQTLYTPVVGDILDGYGRHHQILPAPVQPLRADMLVVGRAMPALMTDVFGPQKKPFGLLTEALDDLRPGEVYIASGGLMRAAYWGELLTAAARSRGAAGAVVNGFHRDTPQVLAQDWPVFSRGSFCQDSAVRTQVADFRCAIEIESVLVQPGDLVFGDIDGVVIVPRDLECEVIARSLEKARGEKIVRKEIENGMSATEAFRRFGIL
jgi:4-hydroxy-4-methyl-2-oxoglutarate aldolase